MSRVLKIMIVLLAIAAMAAPSVFAEDRLSLSGEMRVRGWYKDFDLDNTDSFMDQRLRVFGNIAVAEGVKIQFRTDITETIWGDGGSSYGSGRMASTQQWDRAYLDLTKGAWHLRAGQQYVGYGLAQTVNSQDAGISFDYKGAVKLSGFWLLSDQHTDSATSFVNGPPSDAYVYGANVAYKTDAYAANLFFAGQTEETAVGENVYMIGADVTTNIQAVKLQAEFNYFTGDASDIAGTTIDAIGTQFMLEASMAATETLTVGGQFYYAQGTDDPTEKQYTYLGNDFNGYDPLFDLGTNLHDEKIMFGRPFDLLGSLVDSGFGAANEFTAAETAAARNSGAIGGRIYALAKASDTVNFGGSFAYMEPEQDIDGFDSAMFYAVSMTYALMANTSLQAQLQYVDVDADIEKDTAVLGGVGLYVNF